MTEKFRLAANALLKRRLNKLIRINNNVEIDRNFITCAEYQLFIDDMRQQSKNRQPDHWTSERFPPGDSKKPVTGVRASDAEDFCQWLNQKESVSGFNYRLPSLTETQQTLVTTKDIGCWCKYRNTRIISGIKSQQWRDWQQKLAKYLIFRGDFVLNLNLNLNFNLEFYHNLYRLLYRDQTLYRDQVLDQNLSRFRNRFLYHDLKYVPYRDCDRGLYRDLDYIPYRIFYRVFYHDHRLYLDRDLDRDLNRDLNLVLNRFLYFDQYHKIDTDQASNLLLIYFPLMFIVVTCHLLTTIYGRVAQNNKLRQSINLSRQECEKNCLKYAHKRDEIFPLYVYLVLIEERQKGNMPAWEGIRIVREREEID